MLATTQTLVDIGIISVRNSLEMGSWLTVAERSIRCLIGDEKYDALLAVTDESTTALQSEKDRAVRAEAFYAWYHAAPFINLTEGDCSAFVRATGFDTTRVEIMSKRELDSYRKEATRQAMLLLGDMVQTSTYLGAI